MNNGLPKLIIGFEAYAKTGKDLYGSFLGRYVQENFGAVSERFAFADELKKELDPFLTSTLGISAFTSDPKEKDIIRPILVSWGTDVRRKMNLNHWVAKIEKEIDRKHVQAETLLQESKGSALTGDLYLPYVTDVRYDNEADWVIKNGGIVISIRREGVFPANKQEEENGPIVRGMTPFRFDATTYAEKNVMTDGYKEFIAYLDRSGINERIIGSRSN